MRAKKYLGQNFLHEKKYLHSIRDALDPVANDIVFEVGPGTGNLTAEILPFPATVIAIEKDPDMITELKRRFPEEIAAQKLQLFERDFLETDIGALAEVYGHSYKIVGNIPYYITGLIIRHIFSQSVLPERVVLLVQREVADRIVALDGKQSVLSLSVQVYGQIEYIQTVPRVAFAPVPGVDSAIICISGVSRGRFVSAHHEKLFFACIKSGFAHKRKLLMSNLKSSMQNISAEIIEQWLIDAQYSRAIRAEDVSVDAWIDLSKRFLQWYTDEQ